jgi:3-isopropylmalate/(R)-2-methylmalate dehydratase large subunit
MGKTLFEKIWDLHVVKTIDGGPSVLYIDRHFIHEVTSPQAFNGLTKRGLPVLRPHQVVATTGIAHQRRIIPQAGGYAYQ